MTPLPSKPVALIRREGGAGVRIALVESKAGVALIELSLWSVTAAGEKFALGQSIRLRVEELDEVIAALKAAKDTIGSIS